MPSKKKKQSGYTKKERDTTSSKQEKQQQKGSPSWSIYQNISEILLIDWISFSIDGNLKVLIKDGNPPEQVLYEKAYDLKIQYADAIGDAEYIHYCGLVKEIHRIDLTLLQINKLVEVLKGVYVKQFADQLNRLLSTSFVFDIKNTEQYDKNLSRALNRSKGFKITRDLKKIALGKIEEKYKGNEGKGSREYYMGILISLRQEQGYHISAEDITVWEFCEMIKRYNKHAEMIKNSYGRRPH